MLVECHYEKLSANTFFETLNLQKIRWKGIVKKKWNGVVNAVSADSLMKFILLQTAQKKQKHISTLSESRLCVSWIICYLSKYKPFQLWSEASRRVSIKESSNGTVFIWNRLSGPGLQLGYGILYQNLALPWESRLLIMFSKTLHWHFHHHFLI